jgi:hypothetical protein
MSNDSTTALRTSRRPDFGAEALVYIEKVRKATKRLRAYETNPEDVRGALQQVRDVSGFNVEVPILSARREVQLVKTGVKRLSGWYLGYLAAQLNAFAATVVRLGETVASRVEDLEHNGDELAARVGAVEARLNRLEPKTAATTPPSTAGTTVAKRTTKKGSSDED